MRQFWFGINVRDSFRREHASTGSKKIQRVGFGIVLSRKSGASSRWFRSELQDPCIVESRHRPTFGAEDRTSSLAQKKLLNMLWRGLGTSGLLKSRPLKPGREARLGGGVLARKQHLRSLGKGCRLSCPAKNRVNL